MPKKTRSSRPFYVSTIGLIRRSPLHRSRPDPPCATFLARVPSPRRGTFPYTRTRILIVRELAPRRVHTVALRIAQHALIFSSAAESSTRWRLRLPQLIVRAGLLTRGGDEPHRRTSRCRRTRGAHPRRRRLVANAERRRGHRLWFPSKAPGTYKVEEDVETRTLAREFRRAPASRGFGARIPGSRRGRATGFAPADRRASARWCAAAVGVDLTASTARAKDAT